MTMNQIPLIGTAARFACAQRILATLSDPWVSDHHPHLRHYPDGTVDLLEATAFGWRDRRIGEWQGEIVSADFHFDGASKPRPTWMVVGHPYGQSLLAAIGHDWDFVNRPLLTDDRRMTLEYAAAKYALFLDLWGCGWAQRQVEMLAVVSLPALRTWRSHDGEFNDSACR